MNRQGSCGTLYCSDSKGISFLIPIVKISHDSPYIDILQYTSAQCSKHAGPVPDLTTRYARPGCDAFVCSLPASVRQADGDFQKPTWEAPKARSPRSGAY